MTYRPLIDPEVDERAGLYTARETGPKKDLYEEGVKLMLDSQGYKYDWLRLIDEYAEDKDMTRLEVLNLIIPQVIDEEGEASIQFKEKLGLD